MKDRPCCDTCGRDSWRINRVLNTIRTIREFAKDIYVREQVVDARWGSYALTELPAHKAIEHTLRLIEKDLTS